MPAIEVDGLTEKAVLLPKTGVDAYSEVMCSEAVEIDVKWTYLYLTKGQTTTVRNARGQEVSISALVVVDQKVKVGSLIWKGSLLDWLGSGSADDRESELMEVLTYNETKDFSGMETRRTLACGFYRDAQ